VAQSVLFLPVLWCRQISDHPEESLAKFGCIPDMKVKECKDPSVYSYKSLANWGKKIWKKSSKSGRSGFF
jgi:hypothetical protein